MGSRPDDLAAGQILDDGRSFRASDAAGDDADLLTERALAFAGGSGRLAAATVGAGGGQSAAGFTAQSGGGGVIAVAYGQCRVFSGQPFGATAGGRHQPGVAA